MERKRKIQAKLRRGNNLQRRRKYTPRRHSNYDVTSSSQMSHGVDTRKESNHQSKVSLQYRKLTLIHVYSPTNNASMEDKDDFFEQLESTVQKCNRNDILLITGDLNAKVEKGTPEEREVLGQERKW